MTPLQTTNIILGLDLMDMASVIMSQQDDQDTN
jgi:hypothetical protein